MFAVENKKENETDRRISVASTGILVLYQSHGEQREGEAPDLSITSGQNMRPFHESSEVRVIWVSDPASWTLQRVLWTSN